MVVGDSGAATAEYAIATTVATMAELGLVSDAMARVRLDTPRKDAP